MSKNWSKWGHEFFKSLGRHIGTAGMTWLGLGIKDNQIEWHNLWTALLIGAVLPTTFTFLQSNPVPEDMTVIVPVISDPNTEKKSPPETV